MKGPSQNPGSPATSLGPGLADPAYVKRIKRHYRMVRDKIDRPRRPGTRKPKKHR